MKSSKFSWAFLIFWFFVALIFALKRSFWCDEIVRLDQSYLPVIKGIQQLFAEPSPFSPGEIVLNYIARVLFSGWLPEELWARLPGIFWGLGTLFVVLRISRDQRFRYLPLLLLFSVAFLMISVEMRPYASLIFAGAASALILRERNSKDILVSWAAWMSLIFAHIYGICFVAFASLLRGRWVRALFGFCFVGFILVLYGRHPNPGGNSPIPFFTLVRELLGVLGNPHKVSILFVLLFGAGVVCMWRKEREFCLQILMLLVVSVLCPIGATVISKYFFVPRQSVGGLVPFLAVCAVGIAAIKDISPRLSPAIIAVLVLMSVAPWTMSVILKKPPFPDQPQHDFKQIVHGAISKSRHNILVPNACYAPSLAHYFQKALGSSGPLATESLTLMGIPVLRNCWGPDSEFCVTTPTDSHYCFMDLEGMSLPEPFQEILQNTRPSFDLVIYDSKNFTSKGIEGARAW